MIMLAARHTHTELGVCVCARVCVRAHLCVRVCVIACDISAMAALPFPHCSVKLKQIFVPILLNSFDLCDVRVCVCV